MIELPSYSRAAQKGDRGLRLVDHIISHEYGWIFKRTHQEHDFGIDAHADVVTPGDHVTGQMVAFQIKFGKSYFQEKNRFGYIYRGEAKHFNYLANCPAPVLIVICHESTGDCYWVRFSPEATSTTGQGWKITIPFENKLSGQKPLVEALLPPVVDAKEQMQRFWIVNDLVFESDYIHFIIDKPEVMNDDTSRAREFFDRLRASRELASHCEGKVDISFHGFESDPRELFEIAEVNDYAELLFAALPEAFFFLRTTERSSALKTIALCLSNTRIIQARVPPSGKNRIAFDNKLFVKRFLEPGFHGLNEITEWLGYSEEENKSICERLFSLFGGLPPGAEA